VNEVVQSGEEIPDELADQISNFIQALTERIQELESSVEGLSPNQQPELTPSTYPSSNIYGFNYDYDNNNLLVKFQGNGEEGQGPVYSYSGVPPYMYNLFKQGAALAKTTGKNKWGSWWKGKTPSMGAAMHAFIKKGGYPYQQVA